MDDKTLETMLMFEAEQAVVDKEHKKVFFELLNHVSVKGTFYQKGLAYIGLAFYQYQKEVDKVRKEYKK